MSGNDFYTFSGYMKRDDASLTASMEDYLEMIYRLSHKTGIIRIHELSEALNVQPPSATKMVQKLSELNLINYERYGFITLKDEGKRIGEALLNRHNIIESFLKMLGLSKSVLEETEKMEHTINEETVRCIAEFVDFICVNNDIMDRFVEFKKNQVKEDNSENNKKGDVD